MSTNIQVKTERIIGAPAVAAIDAKSAEELDSFIVEMSQHEADVLRFMDSSQGIRDAREALSMLLAPSRDSLKDVRARRAYAVSRRDYVGHVVKHD